MIEKSLLKKQETEKYGELEDIGTSYPRRLLEGSKGLSDAVLLVLDETAVMVSKTEENCHKVSLFLNECIQSLQKMTKESETPECLKKNRQRLMFRPGLWLDEKRRSVWREEREIAVSRREYEVLYMLFQNKGCVLTYEQIYTRVWKEEYYEGRNSVICLMSRLRKKLNMESCISTVREIGYMYHA